MKDTYFKSKQFIELMYKMLDDELDSIVEEGTNLAKNFAQTKASYVDRGDEKDFSYIITRVRKINNSFVAEWGRHQPRSAKNGKAPFVTKRIRHTQKGGYSSYVVKSEPKWVRDLFDEIEPHYQLLRERSTKISEIRRSLKVYERRLKQCQTLNDIDVY